MKLYRYEVVGLGQLETANHLLTRGWRPLREIPLESNSAAGTQGVLVLFERDDDFPQWSAESIGGVIPVEFLTEVPLLTGMTGEELREIIAACELRKYEAGEVIFAEGEDARELYILLEGQVRLRLPELRLEGTEIMEVGPKDVFGESTFFSPAAHTAAAEAITAARALRLDRERYDELLQAGRTSAYKLALNAAEILGARLQETDLWVWELLKEEQSARIAHSWHRFRQRTSRSTYNTGGFIQP
jgi:CRP/FNR family transcriptional regulator, cyclic AMP receptor protein